MLAVRMFWRLRRCFHAILLIHSSLIGFILFLIELLGIFGELNCGITFKYPEHLLSCVINLAHNVFNKPAHSSTQILESLNLLKNGSGFIIIYSTFDHVEHDLDVILKHAFDFIEGWQLVINGALVDKESAWESLIKIISMSLHKGRWRWSEVSVRSTWNWVTSIVMDLQLILFRRSRAIFSLKFMDILISDFNWLFDALDPSISLPWIFGLEVYFMQLLAPRSRRLALSSLSKCAI